MIRYRIKTVMIPQSGMLPSHKKVVQDIIDCRTEALGGSVYLCKQCEEYRYSYHSCKACPRAGGEPALSEMRQ